MYAVLETGSKQYRVAAGETLEIERIPAEPGSTHTFEGVLLVNQDGQLSSGPAAGKARVLADIVGHIRGPKKIAFKMKRRKGFHKTIGHRQNLTVIRIKEIQV